MLQKLQLETYDASTYDPTDVDKYVRPISAALFNAEYYYAKDSVVIRAVGVPQKTSASAITDGTKRFGTKVGRSNASITVNDEDKKTIPGYEAAGAASGVPEKVKNLKTAVDNWLTEAARGNRSAAGYDVTGDTFSASSFDADGELKAEGSGGNKANDPTQGLLTLAKTAIDGEADATKKAEYLKFYNAAKALARVTASGKHYFEKGKAMANAKTTSFIALTKLSNTQVLTVTNGSSWDGYIKPLIQPFTTTGGDAVIAAGAKLYTLQVKNTAKDTDLRATAQNDKYLVSYDKAKYTVAETADAANVYAQWAFVSGETGYYQIINRGF